MAIIAVNVNKERLKLVIISKPFTLSCFKIIEITPTSVVNIYANKKVAYGKIRPTDLVVLTTDGVHYAVQPEFMADIILKSGSCQEASYNLVQAAKVEVKYPDNMSAMVVHGNPNVN